jgi:DNA ligase D-like protein (predicted ligase)
MPSVSRKAGALAPLSFIPPLLPVPAETPPEGEGWLHEIKHDGNRTMLVIERGQARAFTRRGLDWTSEYRRITDASAALKCRTAILDGEVIVQDKRGLSDFVGLRHAIHREPHRLIYYAFDILHLDGRDLRPLPLTERKEELASLIGRRNPKNPIQFSEALTVDGAKVFTAAEAMGLEGIVSKKASSRYVSGRSPAWRKTKCMTENDFVVIGAAPNPGGAPLALLAREDGDGLRYAGTAFVTLPGEERDCFWTGIERFATTRPAIPHLRNSKTAWCKPRMRVRARHLKGGGEMLRHGSLKALI